MPKLKDLLLKNVYHAESVIDCSDSEGVTEIHIVRVKTLIDPEYKVGRCRIWVDDDDIIKFIVVEQANGRELRVDSEPPLDTSDWPPRARLHRVQDPWS